MKKTMMDVLIHNALKELNVLMYQLLGLEQCVGLVLKGTQTGLKNAMVLLIIDIEFCTCMDLTSAVIFDIYRY